MLMKTRAQFLGMYFKVLRRIRGRHDRDAAFAALLAECRRDVKRPSINRLSPATPSLTALKRRARK
jgi:hypothetical protein